MAENKKDLNRLEEVIGIYGADPGRWPDGDRESLQAGALQTLEGQRLLAEGAALDQLVSMAPKLEASALLTQKILADAKSDVKASAGADRSSTGDSLSNVEVLDQHRIARSVRRIGAFGPELGLLAASLLLGVYLGVSGLSVPVFDNQSELALTAFDNVLPAVSVEEQAVLVEDAI